jgi:MoxR-like ATPase
VVPDDIKALAIPVLAHRLIFSSDQLADLHGQAEKIVTGLLQKVPVPL